MKNKLKFIIGTLTPLSMTFFTYSCSSIQHNESEPDIKDETNKEDKEYDEAYKELWNIYTSLTSTFRSYIKEGVFMTPTSLKNINHMPYSVFNFIFWP